MKQIDVQIIFVDIDGTLLNHRKGHVFDTLSIESLKKAQRDGIKVYLNTARPYHTIEQTGLLKLFKPDGIVSENGGVVMIGNKVVYQDTIPSSLLNSLCKHTIESGLTIECISTKDAFLAAPKTKEVDYTFEVYAEEVPPVKDYHNKKVVSCILFSRRDQDWWLYPLLPRDLKYNRYHDCAVSVTYHEHKKGNGVNIVLEKLGIDKKNAMAIGDSWEDLDMFNNVEYSVVMENSPQELHHLAKFVTKDIEASGVDFVLRYYGLAEEKYPKKNWGVLLPVSSLPSEHGIGDFGEDAFRFIDWLKKENYSYWQILPLNPIGPGNSPYMSTCSQAIDKRYISLTKLEEMGLIKNVPEHYSHTTCVDYIDIDKFKSYWLKLAFEKYRKTSMSEMKEFVKKNEWVKVFATFVTFQNMFKGEDEEVTIHWNEWPHEYRDYFVNHKLPPRNKKDEIELIEFEQWIASKQWEELLEYARSKKVKIIADMPFYVGFDSIDVWLHRDEFMLDSNCKQTSQAGCPPDQFAADGQMWGSPIYNFDKMRENDYSLLVNRTGYLTEHCDILRLDHFRAFDTYYVIPEGATNGRTGEWKIGPRDKFFEELYKNYPNAELIAEDLGDLFPSVIELRDRQNLPGMHIVEFTIFDNYMPSGDNMIVYSGTHDNQTLVGWINSLSDDKKAHIAWRLHCDNWDHLLDAVIDYIKKLPSKVTIFPLQDLLLYDDTARMNTPGTLGPHNFSWRLDGWGWTKEIKIHNK